MSAQNLWGGYTLPLILILLGVFGLVIDPIFLLAFFVLLGYYLYRVEKRLSALEGSPAGQQSKPK